jgi:hypothetical protein
MSLKVTNENYRRAKREQKYIEVIFDKRRELALDEARAELSEAISRVATSLFKDKYGPLLGTVSQQAVNDFLRGFEASVSRTKGDLTLVFEELLDRLIPKKLRGNR